MKAAASVLACSFLLQGCGGLTVTPTGPTTTAPGRVTAGSPTVLRFSGTLEDGGSFNGYILYGSRDIDSRPEYGRFQAAFWETYVTGGALTHDVYFADTQGGRALLETYNTPFPTIGLVFLWPREDPSLQALTPHFHSGPDYQPDLPPGLKDFGELLPGSLKEKFGVFRDGQGGETVVTSVRFDPLVPPPGGRPRLD
jgi:hypothetical protein